MGIHSKKTDEALENEQAFLTYNPASILCDTQRWRDSIVSAWDAICEQLSLHCMQMTQNTAWYWLILAENQAWNWGTGRKYIEVDYQPFVGKKLLEAVLPHHNCTAIFYRFSTSTLSNQVIQLHIRTGEIPNGEWYSLIPLSIVEWQQIREKCRVESDTLHPMRTPLNEWP